MKFSIKDFYSKCDQIRSYCRNTTFTVEILNEKLHFLCKEEFNQSWIYATGKLSGSFNLANFFVCYALKITHVFFKCSVYQT